MLESAHGRGLVYASRAAGGQAIGYYDGTIVTPAEYSELNEDTGLRHTLRVGRAWVNGIKGVTGMQFANTGRGDTLESNNAHFMGATAVVRVGTAAASRGQPVLLPYGWTAAAWAEIESRVVGVCAYEERGGGQGLGQQGGTYMLELVSALRRGGLATHMIRMAREGWAADRGRLELQVHDGNEEVRRYYRGLGMRDCRWWEGGELQAAPHAAGGDSSLYEPRQGCRMMRAEAKDLEAELRRRADERGTEPDGIEFVRATGMDGLRCSQVWGK